MKDIRPMAEERARRRAEEAQGNPAERPPGSGFLTERARAKEALRAEVSTYTGENVRKIAAAQEIAQDDRILRVAAYCRVSTDDIDQLLSIELQKNNYRDMIRANPKWRYVGTYVDDGFSGTNTDHRPAFKLMMKDAMAGKIDMIITKSVSRFARNLLDCIGWVRELKDKHDPPIQVFFEQEHLNTLDATSNIILFVLAMVAEEESHMKSEAMLLSLEWRFSRGRFLTPALLGYDRVEVPDGHGGHKKKLVINEDEANTVRLMYYMLLNGSSTSEIAATLNDLKRETGLRKVCGRSSTKWTDGGVYSVLRNERYCGDVLARKTWTPNFHDHKSKVNRGKKNKYYQSAHHDAIMVAVDGEDGDGHFGHALFDALVTLAAVIVEARVTQDDHHVIPGGVEAFAEPLDAGKVSVGISGDVVHYVSPSFGSAAVFPHTAVCASSACRSSDIAPVLETETSSERPFFFVQASSCAGQLIHQ